MKREYELDICRKAFAHFGLDTQRIKLTEELLELGVRLMQSFERGMDYRKLSGEMADVLILLEQMREHLSQATGTDLVGIEKEYRLNRLAALIGLEVPTTITPWSTTFEEKEEG